MLDPCTPSILINCPNDVIELDGCEFEDAATPPVGLDVIVLESMELDRLELDIVELDIEEFDDIVELDDAELEDIEFDRFGTSLGPILPYLWGITVIRMESADEPRVYD